jgi:transaldolase
MFASPRWQKLQAAGAQIQRPLWASTGVKDPFYRPTLYVDTLIARNTVNTLPEVTLRSITSLTQVKSDAVVTSYQAANEVVKQLSSLSIDLEEVAQKLEEEGLKKFADPWNSLIENVEKAMTS